MYYCMYIIDIYTVYTHLSHLRVPFFWTGPSQWSMCDTQCFHVTDHHPYRLFRGHFLEIKTLNTSTWWFFSIKVLFQPLGEMIQFDESFYKWLAQPLPRCYTDPCDQPPLRCPTWRTIFARRSTGFRLVTRRAKSWGAPMEMLPWDVGSCCELFSKKNTWKNEESKKKMVYLIYCKLESVM